MGCLGQYMNEHPISFLSDSKWLTGIIHKPTGAVAECQGKGVLIVVGGPQTRVGSHRQFLLLARYLAGKGYHVMRFDYHGMGDSEGAIDSFFNATNDIENALEQFQTHCPIIDNISLWGLCDAASAILLFCKSDTQQQISQLVLLNPWVTTEHLKAQVMLKNYYLAKLIDKQFWKKCWRFELNLTQSLNAFFVSVKNSFSSKPERDKKCITKPNKNNYVGLMKQALQEFSGPVCIILSGADLVAAEFELLINQDKQWHDVCSKPLVKITQIDKANHTFASEKWREEVERITLNSLGG